MKLLACLAIALGLLTTFAPAAAPHVEIEARFEGFDRTKFPDLAGGSGNDTGGLLSAPKVTVVAGRPATIEIIREHRVPKTSNEKSIINTGVSLRVQAEVAGGRIDLSGSSIVRRAVEVKGEQPLGAMSFDTRETYFAGNMTHGEPLKIKLGEIDGKQAHIILTAKLVNEKGEPVKRK
jgi:hypothetical protein